MVRLSTNERKGLRLFQYPQLFFVFLSLFIAQFSTGYSGMVPPTRDYDSIKTRFDDYRDRPQTEVYVIKGGASHERHDMDLLSQLLKSLKHSKNDDRNTLDQHKGRHFYGPMFGHGPLENDDIYRPTEEPSFRSMIHLSMNCPEGTIKDAHGRCHVLLKK